MPTDQSNIDYLIDLYNGHNAIAERVNTNRLEEIHVSTELDKKINHWLREGRDIILTGNPGDGKTHLMNVVLNGQDVTLEKDASQKHAEEILDAWRESRKAGRPYILAINHAPLRKLAEEAKNYDDFRYLHDMISPTERDKSEIDNFILYNPEQATKLRQTVIIDLSQRELLTENVIDPLLNKLCSFASLASCEQVLPQGCDRCPIKYNIRALSNRQIRDNLIKVLSLIARRGFHATMRDLIGLLAFIITGGVSCNELWKENGEGNIPDYDYYDYYNLLYEGGRNKLFDALRQIFDPGEYADSQVDMQLWMDGIKEDWIMEESHQPKDLKALKVLKRRYFFEHSEPIEKKLTRVMSNTEREFDELVTREEHSQEDVEKLVEMINLFYAPLPSNTGQNQGYRYRLRLWNNHRYSVGQTAGYVSMRAIEASKLQIYHPRLNPKYDGAIDIHQDHILLAVQNWLPGDAALRVDWEMYQALSAARQGKLIHVQPYHILRRLDLFLRRLGFEVARTSPVEIIEWSNYKQRTVVRMCVDRNRMSYREI